jgi:hypothetical protein
MAAPSSSVPNAEAVTCTNNTTLTGGAGNITGNLNYTMGATTLTIYIPIYHLLEVFTLQTG